ncbi:recombinase RecA [Klebsiella pneumoniae]|uniref:recombinase RecA n=1 Tax=Klebsiella pneumoniae TaxID=573 RepID=UPI00255059A5|nr:recombinase RecA [Klebsiella pneumoniae]ELZ3335886.1 recombinase RecA [Klebsiella pneumoniae]MDK6284941.1 recombinase RecA [Klebsiella pneumoniae]HBQ1036372.1 recombinase RecA [Klebsiella pneumoniae]HBW1195280.1 recombinase RecA [Klebsiella pneumoniae]HDZ2106051.1 recombinase RecA [Klebsiella pneumoniae]
MPAYTYIRGAKRDKKMMFFYMPEDWESPQWETDNKIPHHWHNYVSEEVRSIWDTFSQDQKQKLSSGFVSIAMNEEWE